MQSAGADHFKGWRTAARDFLVRGVPPDEILWTPDTQGALSLECHRPVPSLPLRPISVSKEFLKLAETCACFRDNSKWALLYRALWRLTHGTPHLLHLETDPDVRQIRLMEKAVRRDIHKMHAFVRFREVPAERGPIYVAWHRPDHLILEKAAPFFVRRFGSMRWSLLTPDASAEWAGDRLVFGPGVDASAAPTEDKVEHLWRTYYASIFNPARLKVRMMKKEMPVRHWATLPETTLIPELLRQVPERLEAMRRAQPASAAPFVPAGASWPELKLAAKNCTACELCAPATQTVFGEGPVNASLVLLGEQPGDEEDVQGRPFVGPAGQLLDRLLQAAGLVREAIYLTNVVKHFRFTRKGPMRFHQKPSGVHQRACRPWLEAEMGLVKPETLVCLGVTAAQAVLGRAVTLKETRGTSLRSPWAERVIVTYHPAGILRMPDRTSQEIAFQECVEDLRRASEVKRPIKT